MNKIICKFVGVIVAFSMAFGGVSTAQATSGEPAPYGKPVYAYYYLWWSSNHWKNKLGPNYPYTSSAPLPMPARTDVNGCNAASNYAGNQLLDVGANQLFSQDNPGLIQWDIQAAKNAGITGFWLNWAGAGTTTQTRTSVSLRDNVPA